MTTLVSIITPAFHAQDFIARAVRSVIAQGYSDWEIIIISDDGQDYRRILREQNISSDRIVFTSTGKIGTGPGAARNVGLDHANGRIIATLDADDEFLPGKLEIMLPKTQRYGFCSCELEYAEYEDGQFHSLPFPQPVKESGLLTAAQYPLVNYSMNSMLVFDRERFPMRWPENLQVMEDIVFAMQAYNYADAVYHCPQVLHRYVRRVGSLSNSPDTPQRFIHAKQEILRLLQMDDFYIKSAAARDSLRSFIAISLETEREYEHALQRGATPIFLAMLVAALVRKK